MVISPDRGKIRTCAAGRKQKERPPREGWRSEAGTPRTDDPLGLRDTPRSLRRYDPDQVPRDCLNPANGVPLAASERQAILRAPVWQRRWIRLSTARHRNLVPRTV